MPPAHFVGRARRTLLRYPELVPFWGHLLRQGVGQMVRPPFAHWPPTKNRLPPAQDVGCASGTLRNCTSPCAKCWTVFRHPPSQDLVFEQIWHPSCTLRWTDWAHPPSPMGHTPILSKAVLKVLDGFASPPFGVEMRFKNARASCATCRTPPVNPPSRNVMSIQF